RLNLVVALPEGRHLNVAAVGDGKFVRVRIARRNPYGRVRLLQWFRRRRGRRKLEEFPVMRVVAGPYALDRRDEFAHALASTPGIETGQQTLVFERIGPARD